MSMNSLGYYEKSYRLMMLPLQNITHVISPVMHPVFSNFQDDPLKLALSYEKVIRILAFIGFPLSVLLSTKQPTIRKACSYVAYSQPY